MVLNKGTISETSVNIQLLQIKHLDEENVESTTGQLRCLTLKDEKQREHVGHGACGGCGTGWPMITFGQTRLKGHKQGRTAG